MIITAHDPIKLSELHGDLSTAIQGAAFVVRKGRFTGTIW
jgi:hypothetical protein